MRALRNGACVTEQDPLTSNVVRFVKVTSAVPHRRSGLPRSTCDVLNQERGQPRRRWWTRRAKEVPPTG